MLRPTGVSRHVIGVHLDVIVTPQSPVDVIHILDRSGQDVERDGVFVRRGRGRFQLSAPGVREGDGTGRRSGGIRDDFTERGERKVEFCRERPDELSVDVHYFSNRAKKRTWVSDDRQWGRAKDSPFGRDPVVNDRPGILRECIPDHRHSVMSSGEECLLTI